MNVRITWCETGTRNAACIGHDEVVQADSCQEAAEGSLDAHPEDWLTGRYDIVADEVDGDATYGIQYEAP